MKNKVMMAAAVVAVMCGAARASGQALDSLRDSVPADIIKDSPIAQPAAAQKGGADFYANAQGCRVTVERRANGSTLYVQTADGRQATLGVMNDLKRGDIFAFCSPAEAQFNGGSLTLSCGEQHNGGLPTRGLAVIGMGEGITSVSVRGEVKKTFGWKTDTDINCDGLKPEPSRGRETAETRDVNQTSVFYGNAYRVWDRESGAKAEKELGQYTSVLGGNGVKVLAAEVVEVEGYLYAKVTYSGKQVLFRSTGSAYTVAGAGIELPTPKYGPDMQTLKWSAVLNGKTTSVQVYYAANGFSSNGKIFVGAKEYSLNDRGRDTFGGVRQVKVNNTVKEDENVQIMPLSGMGPEFQKDPAAAAKQFGISNWKEIKCSQGDSFLMVGDNITGGMIGNCITPAK